MIIDKEWLDRYLPPEPTLAMAGDILGAIDLYDHGRRVFPLCEALTWLAAQHEQHGVIGRPPDWRADPDHPRFVATIDPWWPVSIDFGYKGRGHYLTAEGWPLGTQCWYVRIEHGSRVWIAAESVQVAAARGVVYVAALLKWRIIHPEDRPPWPRPLESG